MIIPSNTMALQALLLRAASDGREEHLFGDSFARAREILPDFLPEGAFPEIYLEFPLLGKPFLDATILYHQTEIRHLSVSSPAVVGTMEMLNWFDGLNAPYKDVCCGYELDFKKAEFSAAGVHLQPRTHLELVEPFCKSLGETRCAPLYLEMAKRMQDTWPLSFLGLFRGRPDSPLRVCGYLLREELDTCKKDAGRIMNIFKTAGFSAVDETMIRQICDLFAATPGVADFQFDIEPDGSCGDMFAIDVMFESLPSGDMITSFDRGKNHRLMELLESWKITDARWKNGVELSFTKSFPVTLEDSSTVCYALSLLPQWIKIRWIDGRLQPSKLYLHAKAGIILRDY